jgi:hypothetical membrane protein
VLVFIGGLLTPGYSQLSQTISKLGEVGAPYAILTDANLVLTGVLITVFIVGIHRSILQGRGSKLGPAMLLALPVTLILQGTIFPLPNPAHAPLGYVSFVLTVIGLFVISRELKRDNRWKGYGSYTILTGILSAALFLMFFVVPDSFAPWFGLLQKIALTPIFLWIEVMAMKLFVVTRHARL